MSVENIALVNALYGVMRTDLLRKTGIHGAYLGADVVVQEEIALYGKIWEIPEFLYFRRMHAAAHSAMSDAQKGTFFDPGAVRGHEFKEVRQLGERLRAIWRSPLSVADKSTLVTAILRSAISGRADLMRELADAVRSRVSRTPS